MNLKVYELHHIKMGFLKIIYFFMRDREREAKGEAGSPLRREPDVGLHPRNLGSWLS